MKYLAIFLLVVCLYDVIKPFWVINQQRRELKKSWIYLAKTKGFSKFAFSIAVNVVAIVFFVHYLYR